MNKIEHTCQCIICEKPLTDSMHEWFRDYKKENPNLVPSNNGPAFGVACFSDGNFGSQVFDCSGKLEFYVCDVCLTRKADRFLIYQHGNRAVNGTFGFFQVDKFNPVRVQLVKDAYNKAIVAGMTAYDFTGNPIGVIKECPKA